MDSSAHAGFGKSPGAADGVPGAASGGLAAGAGGVSSLEFVLDGVERPVRRPKDKNRQKRHYSGKKKRHGLKNLVVACRGQVKGLSRTAPGSVHDKKMDTRFTGYNPAQTDALMPRKKPKGKPLDPVWKMINRGISRLRVGVEHALAGIKRCHIVADLYRNTKPGFEDAGMLWACGLHNFRAPTEHRHEPIRDQQLSRFYYNP